MSEAVATILVVDDNPATLYSTGRFLRAAGFHIREAVSGQEALDRAEEGPSAIVLDVNLPDIDGFEVCRTLRRRQLNSRTPIIHLSATFVGADYKVLGLDAGADGYLTHPVEPPVLVATLNAFLRARAAEDQMRQSEERFRAIFDGSINGIALVSERLEFAEANPTLCRIMGRERSEIIGRSITAFAPSGAGGDKDKVIQELKDRGVWNGEFQLVRPDGKVVALDWHLSLYSLPNLHLAEVTDITDRRVAEREREYLLASERAARAEAERANRVKDEFLAMVSHELRSPLNAIVGWAKHLKSARSTDIQDYFKGVDAIDRNASLQARLIADLLDVSSFTTGVMRLDFRPLDIIEIVRNSLDNHLIAAKEKSIAIDTAINSTPVPLLGDVGRLQQMMGNLLANAVKFTPRGGRIRIQVELHPLHIEIGISDTGIGISKEFLPHIFETFRQEDTGSARSADGLGLGLAIVKRIVNLHGGTISAQSEGKDKGTAFIVRLPLASLNEIEKQDGMQSASIPGGILRAVRVLIVDDDADTRFLLTRILNAYGAIVSEAGSAVEALDYVRVASPQVMISDIGLPGDDGYALIRQIRASGYDALQLPAIALTAFVRPEDRIRALSNGFQVHFGKPLDPYSMVRTILDLIGRRGANAASL